MYGPGCIYIEKYMIVNYTNYNLPQMKTGWTDTNNLEGLMLNIASIKFRLIGIGISNLSPETRVPGQLNLFKRLDVREDPWGNVERAMDTIKDRFGKNAINC